ncbi:uncharacterized protein LOC110464689 [Mizuhopecten yessoensis]|uniref:Transmembrane protein 130 n=1 Tax=Mizuhopecten yessoensis TaxID=6573 RepID=A0A210PTA4_MIZYE|nr:uncharacterized protein LOC110464689 [Mizuhopecten yessoensis]OWF39727.1 Transmembrane protein 130 [Mizuhopecten yessoensis]
MKLYVFIVYFLVSFSHPEGAYTRIPGCNKSYVGIRGKRINTDFLPKGPEVEVREISDEYRLEIKNTGPVVLDSRIDFMAKMFNKTGHLADSTSFLYVWNNDADFHELRKEDNFEANMTQTYSFVLPSQYTMQVCVYSKEEKLTHIKYHLVAKGGTKFTLTSLLNGKIDLKQSLSYQKHKKVLATNIPIDFSVNLTDKFQSKPTSSFHWFNGKTLLGHTTVPKFVFTLKKAEKMEKLSVSVSTSLEDEFVEKKGEWSEDVQVKDAIQGVKWNLSGRSSVDVNNLLNLTVFYKASNPTVICWEVCEAKKNSSYCSNTTCESPLTGNRKQFDVQVGFPSVGLYHIHFRLENDVSQQHYRTGVVHVYATDSYSSHGYAIPIFFSCLGVFIVLVSSIYFVRMKRKPHVETADFDFHPSLNREEPHPIITGIKRTFTHQFFQPKHLYSSLQQPRTSARSYDSMSENGPL